MGKTVLNPIAHLPEPRIEFACAALGLIYWCYEDEYWPGDRDQAGDSVVLERAWELAVIVSEQRWDLRLKPAALSEDLLVETALMLTFDEAEPSTWHASATGSVLSLYLQLHKMMQRPSEVHVGLAPRVLSETLHMLRGRLMMPAAAWLRSCRKATWPMGMAAVLERAAEKCEERERLAAAAGGEEGEGDGEGEG